MISCFGVMWSAAIMVFNDCQRDFRRIERRAVREGGGGEVEGNGHAISSGVQPLNGSAKSNGNGATVDRSPPPVQTAPRTEQLVMPVALDAAQGNGQGDNGDKGNGPKK